MVRRSGGQVQCRSFCKRSVSTDNTVFDVRRASNRVPVSSFSKTAVIGPAPPFQPIAAPPHQLIPAIGFHAVTHWRLTRLCRVRSTTRHLESLQTPEKVGYCSVSRLSTIISCNSGTQLANQSGPTIEYRQNPVRILRGQADISPSGLKVTKPSQLCEVIGRTANSHWQRTGVPPGFGRHLAETWHVFIRIAATGVRIPAVAIADGTAGRPRKGAAE